MGLSNDIIAAMVRAMKLLMRIEPALEEKKCGEPLPK
jgi:hypothetical protein